MKKHQTISVAATIVILSELCFSASCLADESADAEAARQSQYNALVDTEKQLLKANDDLSKAIWDVKQAINDLDKKLAQLQEEQDKVRHHLITVHMKLMP